MSDESLNEILVLVEKPAEPAAAAPAPAGGELIHQR